MSLNKTNNIHAIYFHSEYKYSSKYIDFNAARQHRFLQMSPIGTPTQQKGTNS